MDRDSASFSRRTALALSAAATAALADPARAAGDPDAGVRGILLS